MIVIRLFKNKNKYNINAYYNKQSIKGKPFKKIGFYNPNINLGKKYFIDYKLLLYYIKKGAKISKRLFELLKI